MEEILVPKMPGLAGTFSPIRRPDFFVCIIIVSQVFVQCVLVLSVCVFV